VITDNQFLFLIMILNSCLEKKNTKDTIKAVETNLCLQYGKKSSTFKLWSPTAEKVKLNFYKNGVEGEAY
ncbi:MAG: hypothetical protein ACO3VF_10310, partial [Tamlana sp.]